MLEEALRDAEDKKKRRRHWMRHSTSSSNRKESTPKDFFSWKVPRWRKENVYHVSATDEEKKSIRNERTKTKRQKEATALNGNWISGMIRISALCCFGDIKYKLNHCRMCFEPFHSTKISIFFRLCTFWEIEVPVPEVNAEAKLIRSTEGYLASAISLCSSLP